MRTYPAASREARHHSERQGGENCPAFTPLVVEQPDGVSLPLGEGKERFLEDHLAVTLKAPAENIYTLSIWNDMEQVFSVGWLDGDNRRSPSRNDLPNFQGPYHSYSFAGWQLMTKCAFSIQWQDLEISWSVRLGLKLTLKSRLRKSFSISCML